jgi:alpha-tubulin suppressor-like RCC1 family protein
LALLEDGTVRAWGYKGQGQTNVPSSLSNAIAVAGGANHSQALRSNGTGVARGANDAGQPNVPN